LDAWGPECIVIKIGLVTETNGFIHMGPVDAMPRVSRVALYIWEDLFFLLINLADEILGKCDFFVSGAYTSAAADIVFPLISYLPGGVPVRKDVPTCGRCATLNSTTIRIGVLFGATMFSCRCVSLREDRSFQ